VRIQTELGLPRPSITNGIRRAAKRAGGWLEAVLDQTNAVKMVHPKNQEKSVDRAGMPAKRGILCREGCGVVRDLLIGIGA
jgi:hypothetical protein